MAKQTSYNPKLAAYWGTIQAKVNEKANVSQIWQAVREKAAAEGADLSGVRIFDMNQIRSLAVEVRNSSQRFMSASDTSPIDSTMVSRYINSRSLISQNEVPKYQIRFEQNVMEEGKQQTLWRTIEITGNIPVTKRALMAEIEANAIAIANKYKHTHINVGKVELAAV